MTTTSKLADFIGRALHNRAPGTSDATDYLGRNVGASNTDYMGRALQDTPSYPPANIAVNTAYTLGQTRRVPGVKEVQTLTATGTPAGNLKLGVTLNGQTLPTANIAVGSISAATILAALNALANVDPGDIAVGGTGPWTLTFSDEFGNVTQITVDNSGVTGGTYAAATTTQGAVNGAILQCTVAGTTHASTPVATPANVGDSVTSGTATFVRVK